jgi:hypothetical protein
VSVYGTVPVRSTLEIISRRSDECTLRLPVGRLPLTAQLKEWICQPLSTPHRLDRNYHSPAATHLTRHPLEPQQRYGNINPFPIDYASQPRLRGRLTLGRRPLPRKPWAFGGRESHPSLRILMPASSLPLPPANLAGSPSSACGTLPYHSLPPCFRIEG